MRYHRFYAQNLRKQVNCAITTPTNNHTEKEKWKSDTFCWNKWHLNLSHTSSHLNTLSFSVQCSFRLMRACDIIARKIILMIGCWCWCLMVADEIERRNERQWILSLYVFGTTFEAHLRAYFISHVVRFVEIRKTKIHSRSADRSYRMEIEWQKVFGFHLHVIIWYLS